MKPGGSSLNPYAAAYVPLSKREEFQSAKPTTHQHVQQHQPHQGYGVQRMGSYPQISMPKKSSEVVYNHEMKDEDLDMDMDMDIDYLLVTFSGLSYESINDVYLANNGDLDATIEMLNQLEIYSSEAEEYLPDTLYIGDVPEITTKPSSSTISKQKNEVTASTSTPNVHVSSSS